MGKRNKKARSEVKTVIDNSELKKIQLDESLKNSIGSYDDSNALVLPSQKRKTKIIRDEKTKVTRILSKKRRKGLEKVIERKNKKEKRASLLEALSKVHAAPEELNHLTSIVSIQTKGLKRFYQEEANPDKIKSKSDHETPGKVKLNSIRGSKRHLLQVKSKVRSDDPNTVGFYSSSSDSEDSSELENEEENEAKKIKLEDEKLEDINSVENQVDSTECCQDNDTNEVSVIEQEMNVIEVKDEPEKKSENNATKKECKPAVYVDVTRSKEIQEARLKLPILAEEQQIMETINENSVIIIAGETGSGKTTQVPQFLYEAGYAIDKQIAVTEPRRVAAIAMSKRVGEEMSLTSREVSFLIRFEGNVTEDTKIKFMTDGVLLKEVQKDFMLSKYSVVILDEAHERSVYTDILVGLLSRIVKLRNKRGNPLKLIIMSATLRLEDFISNARLFKETPPVIKVDTRQFPVSIHFSKRTNENYLSEAFSKIVKIHTKLPEGGILAFVTGQQEVNSLVRKLRKAFPLNERIRKGKFNNKDSSNEEIKKGEDSDDSETETKLNKALRKAKRKTKVLPEIDLDDYSIPGDNDDVVSGDESDLSGDDDDEVTVMLNCQPLWVLPLYSLLPSHEQAKVFKPPPEGCRLCVISTNVAETSLTIPHIKYVVDTGKTKVKLYDKMTGVSTYVVTWTSKASAGQRAGRAGRLGPGHCYRLYSSAVFNDTFQDFSVPEIQQKPIDDLYLTLKSMHIDKVINFPFPTAPDLLQLKAAEYRLNILGAIKDNKITPLGKAIIKFPVLPRFGKMLALSHQQDLMPYTICLVAALSVPEVLLEVPILPDEDKSTQQQWAAIRQHWAGKGNSLLLGDNMILLKAVGGAEFANSKGELEKFCKDYGLRQKAIIEIRKLRIQLTNVIKANIPECDITVDPKLPPPSDVQIKLLRQVLLAGMGDQVAKKYDLDEIPSKEKAKFKYAYHVDNMDEPVFLHRGSVLRKHLPEFVVYNELYETNKTYMRGITAIEPEWLAKYVPGLCNLGEPLSQPEPRYNEVDGKVLCTVTGTFGKSAWQLPHIEVEYPLNVEYYKWFGKFLISGLIFEKLGKYKDHLLNQPGILVKSWGQLQPRCVAFVKALATNGINSKADLEQLWQGKPQLLLKEYLDWVKEEQHSAIRLMWPPL